MVNVYINGIFKQTATITTTQEIVLSTAATTIDTVSIQYLAHIPTEDELELDPDVLDDPEILVHYKYFTFLVTQLPDLFLVQSFLFKGQRLTIKQDIVFLLLTTLLDHTHLL
jgi:hypothetical protein